MTSALLVPVTFALGGQLLSLFTTLTSFGAPGDVTVDELAVELFYPADEATERAFARRRYLSSSPNSCCWTISGWSSIEGSAGSAAARGGGCGRSASPPGPAVPAGAAP